jgi:hypothetical protein
MRLSQVTHGHRLPQKLFLAFLTLVTRRRVPDVLRALFFRPAYFGRDLNELFQEAMRGRSRWTVAEREAMAAFVSSLNHCVF